MSKDFNIFLEDQPKVVEDNQVVKQSLISLISTEQRTRPFNRTYGLGLHQFVGSLISPALAEDIALILRIKLEKVEPRIVVNKKSVSVVMLSENDLGLSFSYYVKDTHSWDSFSTTLTLN
jgi:phage baseplate assembly protein W